MKKLLVLLFSMFALSLSVNAADVYYCSDDAVVGFHPPENYKQYTYNEEKFKIMIDFDKKNVFSEHLFFNSNWNQKCFFNMHNTLSCRTELGMAFAINKANLRYVRSKIYTKQSPDDDIFIAHGSCEKF